MLKRIEETLRTRGLIRPGVRVVAAVSGGADSMALLYGLWFLQRRMAFQLFAAHLHHGLRGDDADGDAELVVRVCGQLNIPLRFEKEPVATTRKRRGVSMEMAAREARLDFFRRASAFFQADVVATAHHADDQAETVFMRLLTGSGIEGLGGMDYRSDFRPALTVIRPLLDVHRAEIVSFLTAHRLSWREDKTNRDVAMLRNRVRHRIFPYLIRQGFPKITASLVRLADIMREEQRLLESQTEALLQQCQARAAGPLSLTRWRALPVAGQRRVLRVWFAGHDLLSRGLDFARIEKLRLALLAHSTGCVSLSENRSLTWKSDRAHVDDKVKPTATPLQSHFLAVPGCTPIPEIGTCIEVTASHGFRRSRRQKIGSWPATAFVRRETGRVFTWEIRARREGDRIQPTGMKGAVSIKDLMINEKVAREHRDRIPVLLINGEVAWVPGYRVSRPWSVKSDKSPSWKIVLRCS